MSLVLIIYLVGIAGALQHIFGVFSLITGVSAFFSVMCLSLSNRQSEKDTCKKLLKTLIPLTVVLALLAGVIPSKRTTNMMLAAYGVESISQMEEAKETGSKAFLVLDKYLDKTLEEMGDETYGND